VTVLKEYDEPIFVDVTQGKTEDGRNQVEAEIRELCSEQPFAVLATQGGGQPYTNLISYAFSENFEHLVFATPAQTRKYLLIVKNNKVSLLIDNRDRQPESINLIRAVTVTGKAKILEDPDQIEKWSGLLVSRHSYLEKFIKSSTSGLILVDTIRFFYVRRFQEVYQWIPGSHS
jgi:nitroimidazol reductase NimA-like FMN-containing flavoprotein (pyridoxamine 5'-phosphate oxidase superfamily)